MKLENLVLHSLAERLIRHKCVDMAKNIYEWMHPITLEGLPHPLISQVICAISTVPLGQVNLCW
jgi:hypothetical protein